MDLRIIFLKAPKKFRCVFNLNSPTFKNCVRNMVLMYCILGTCSIFIWRCPIGIGTYGLEFRLSGYEIQRLEILRLTGGIQTWDWFSLLRDI